MNMPGFTAEVSLPTGNSRYQATTAAIIKGDMVQPAQVFSDSIDLDKELPHLIFRFRYNCLKKVCIHHVIDGIPTCEWKWVPAIC